MLPVRLYASESKKLRLEEQWRLIRVEGEVRIKLFGPFNFHWKSNNKMRASDIFSYTYSLCNVPLNCGILRETGADQTGNIGKIERTSENR